MTREEMIEAIQELASEVGRATATYSGRGMYGATCWGVVTDQPNRALIAAGALGLPEPHEDRMGKGFILYWPEACSP